MLGDHLAFLNGLDDKLSKLEPDQLDQLYLRVFNTDDGNLVLRDLENRCFHNAPADSLKEEGARRVYLSIQTRINNALTGNKEEDKDV